MDELDLFRDFRHGVASPSGDAHRRASAHLATAVAGGRTRATKLRGYRVLAFAVVAIAGATVAALFLTTPWHSSPGFLEKAQAALAPQAGMILHEKWELTTISTDPTCTVKRGPSEIWIDETPPYRVRAVLNEFPLDPPVDDPRALICSRPTASEVGGTLDPVQTLRFIPPNTLSASGHIQFQFPPDPVSELRESINTGSAHDEGKTTLNGRTVERIRIDPPPDCPVSGKCSRELAYAYVDPETFHPVQLESPHGYIMNGSGLRFDAVRRTLTFEYLPRTADNLALTDIEAQHPNAKP